MDFHLNSNSPWYVAIAASVVSLALGLYGVTESIHGQSFALFLGMLPAYLLLSNYILLRLISRIESKGWRFSKISCVLFSVAFLLVISWVMFGAYFYTSAVHGHQSTDQLAINVALRNVLKAQQAIAVLICLVHVKKGGAVDFFVSLLLACVLGIVILG